MPVVDASIRRIADAIAGVSGVTAVVLGGSRATGSASPGSDIDLGIYYRAAQPLDIEALSALATELDDAHRPDLVTPIGGWGPWINGGGWLTINGVAVDLIYRDMNRVAAEIVRCHNGEIDVVYQPGHPHMLCSALYMGEAALCVPLVDRDAVLAVLKSRTQPYPRKLQVALVERFAWEIDFALGGAAKDVDRRDIGYVAGCLFRASACVTQTLFALNARHTLNEKGAVARAAALPIAPADLSTRVDGAFAVLYADPAAAIANMRVLADETRALVRGAQLLV